MTFYFFVLLKGLHVPSRIEIARGLCPPEENMPSHMFAQAYTVKMLDPLPVHPPNLPPQHQTEAAEMLQRSSCPSGISEH